MRACFYGERLVKDEGCKISLERADGAFLRLFRLTLNIFFHMRSAYNLRVSDAQYNIGPSWRGTSLRKGEFELAYITGVLIDDIKIEASSLPLVSTKVIDEAGLERCMSVEEGDRTVCKIKVYYALLRNRVELDYERDIGDDFLALSIAVALRLIYY